MGISLDKNMAICGSGKKMKLECPNRSVVDNKVYCCPQCPGGGSVPNQSQLREEGEEMKRKMREKTEEVRRTINEGRKQAVKEKQDMMERIALKAQQNLEKTKPVETLKKYEETNSHTAKKKKE